MALTTLQIEALIEQVGADRTPADLDREKLKQNIEWAGARYRSRKLSGSESIAKKRSQWLKRTKSITAKLQEVLRDEENARWFNIRAPATFSTVESNSKAAEPTAQADEVDTADAELRDEEEGISYDGLLAALDGLHKEVSKQLSGRPRNVFQLSRSPFEYFAGELMPEIFSKHFERKIGISRAADNGEPGGPLLRFVKAGMELLDITHNGKPYAKEAIARAIRDTKSRPSRRKNSASGQKS